MEKVVEVAEDEASFVVLRKAVYPAFKSLDVSVEVLAAGVDLGEVDVNVCPFGKELEASRDIVKGSAVVSDGDAGVRLGESGKAVVRLLSDGSLEVGERLVVAAFGECCVCFG